MNIAIQGSTAINNSGAANAANVSSTDAGIAIALCIVAVVCLMLYVKKVIGGYNG